MQKFYFCILSIIYLYCISKISIFSKYFQLEDIFFKTKRADIDELVGVRLS